MLIFKCSLNLENHNQEVEIVTKKTRKLTLGFARYEEIEKGDRLSGCQVKVKLASSKLSIVPGTKFYLYLEYNNDDSMTAGVTIEDSDSTNSLNVELDNCISYRDLPWAMVDTRVLCELLTHVGPPQTAIEDLFAWVLTKKALVTISIWDESQWDELGKQTELVRFDLKADEHENSAVIQPSVLDKFLKIQK